MKPVYHFISHSHWDREWYKPFETFRLDLVDMINSLLDILENNPDYKHFTLDGQTIVLEDFAKIMPEQAKTLNANIKAGRISIGPWYILPDEFLVAGESTIRNLQFGRKVGERFGPVMEIGYIPDSFGHLAMMPAILQGFEMDTAIVFRGFGGEPDQTKSEYRWRAPDGSEVLMLHLPPNGYGDAYIGEDNEDAFIRKGHALKTILDHRATTPHRLCMNGGDHHFPEPYLPRALSVMNESCEGQFIHSSIPAYVDSVKQSLGVEKTGLSVIEGELRGGFRYAFAVQSGVYSSRIYLKQANYACERGLTRYAEPLSMWASLSGRENLNPMLQQAWKTLLKNHPHDSICGCSVDAVHREMMTRFEKCGQISSAVAEKSIRHLYPDQWDKPESIIVFNPRFRKVSHPVEAEIEFFRQDIIVGLNENVNPDPELPLIPGFRLLDDEGGEVVCQITEHVKEGHGLRYSDYSYPSKRLVERFKLLINSKDVPGLGFARYRVEKSDRLPEFHSDLQASDSLLENEYLRITVNGNGSIDILDKRNGSYLKNMLIFEDSGDAGDEYNYSYPRNDRVITSNESEAQISLMESGPLRISLQIRLTLEVPLEVVEGARVMETVDIPISTRVSLYKNQPRVECETEIENNAKDHRLRVLFRTGFQTDVSYADSQFCVTRRYHQPVENPESFRIEIPTSVHPMQRAVTILGNNDGMTIAAAGLPEYELKTDESGTLALTLLRCVGRLSGGDLLTRPGGEAGWITNAPEAQCQGNHVFKYAVIPHSVRDFEEYGPVNEQIEAFHLPLLAQRRGGDPAISLERFGLSLEPSSLVVSTLKPAEDERGWVLRFYNPTKSRLTGELRSVMAIKKATLTRLNERDLKDLRIENDRYLKFEVEPFKIISVRLELDNAEGRAHGA